jgi:TolB-like protein/class 3 adenylate cyclase
LALAARVDRRLAAVLAADVVGYSRLVQHDEQGTLDRLKAHRKELIEPLVAEHGGRIVKLMGDGILCEFPSAVHAVAIQRGMAEREKEVPEAERIRLRIGINVGDVVHEDGDILGDGVNVAARLQALAEPGGVLLARNVHNQIKDKLDFRFEPAGRHRVKNIAEPVEVWRVAPGEVAARAAGGRRLRLVHVAAALALLLLLALGAAGWWYQTQVAAEAGGLPLPDKPSLAVLPFDNLSGDERLGRLADGMVDDIITDLSRFRELFVIARNSTFVYKGKPHDVRQVGRELGVKYMLEGSVQSDSRQLRVTTQLIDTFTGAHVWSERYDRPLDDLFAVQDEVTTTIAATLGSGKIPASELERTRRKAPTSLRAYDYALLSTYHRLRLTKEDNAKALEFARKAVELDPISAHAHVELAWAYNTEAAFAWNLSWREAMDGWHDAARKAVALDPSDGMAHACLGVYYAYTSDFERSLAEFEKALQLEPNNADVLIYVAKDLPWLEPPGRAAGLVERAFRLNPHPPLNYYNSAKHPYYYAGQFDKTIAAIKAKGDLPHGYDLQLLAMSYAQLGRDVEAREAAAQRMRNDPDFSAERELSEGGEFAPAAVTNRALYLEGRSTISGKKTWLGWMASIRTAGTPSSSNLLPVTSAAPFP